MQVQEMKITEIRPYEKNPRHNDNSVEAVANSIKEFGFQQPIVVDKDLVIIAGHTRYKAAKKLGMKTIPVIIAEGLSDEQVKAYRIADNSAGEASIWNFDALLDEIADLSYDMADFGLLIPDMTSVELKPTNDNRNSEELDISQFDEDNFDCECPRCHFRFNREG